MAELKKKKSGLNALALDHPLCKERKTVPTTEQHTTGALPKPIDQRNWWVMQILVIIAAILIVWYKNAKLWY